MATAALDIFDQIAPSKKRDIFDEIGTPAQPSMLERVGKGVDAAGDWLFGGGEKRTTADEVHGVRNPNRVAPSSDDGVLTMPAAGAVQAAKGFGAILNPRTTRKAPQSLAGPKTRPDWASPAREMATGASDVIEGGMKAATPFLPEAIVANPLTTGAALATGMAAQHGAQAGLEYLGAPDEYARLGGNVAGVVAGGIAGHKAGQIVDDARGMDAILNPSLADLPENMPEAGKPNPGSYSGETYGSAPAKPSEPTSAELPTVPESDNTIGLQVEQLQSKQRKVVMIPDGTKMPNVPRGLSIIRDRGARYIFDPKAITPREIRSAAKRNALPDILGAKEGGMGTVDKTALDPNSTVAVVGKTPEGVTAQGTLADENTLPAAVEQTSKLSPNVEVVPPEQEIAERLQDQSPAPQGEEVVQHAPENQERAGDIFDQIHQESKPAADENGDVMMDPRETLADPERFQFKSDAIGKGGTTDKLRDVTSWNPRVAGTLSIWQDPANGKYYVINGHHRLELAQRLGVGKVKTQIIDAPDAVTARGIGALDNVLEGNGSAVDAAKVFRDLKLTDEELQSRGMNLKGSMARDVAGLRDLTPEVFDPVTRGDFDPKNAATIGRMLKNPADQIAAAKLIERAEAGGKTLKPTEVERLIRMTQGAERGVETQDTLFGEQVDEQNYAVEQAQLADWLAKQIGKEKRLFATVGDEGAAQRLAGKGNVIKASENQAVAEQAAQAAELFDRMYDRSGPIADALREGAGRIGRGENANGVRNETYSRVRQAISDLFGAKQGSDSAAPGSLAPERNPEGPHSLDRSGLSGTPAEQPPAPTHVELEAAGQGGLFGGERGSFSLRRSNPPTTPEEIYVDNLVQKQDAARKGPKAGIVAKITAALRKIKAGTVDSTAPVTDLLADAQKEFGYEVLPQQNIDYQIDRVLRSSAIARQFIEDRGLESVIHKVDDVDKFGQYLAARQAGAVEANGVKTGRDSAQDANLVAKWDNRQAYPPTKAEPNPPTYKQLADQIRKYNHELLDYGVESGLIHKDLAQHLKQLYPDYVPLQRIFSDDELVAGHWSSPAVASLSKQQLVQRIQGSEREIENPLASMIAKTFDTFAQGERNKAGRMLADYRDLPGFQNVIRELGPNDHADANTTFSYLDQGKKRTFATTKDMAIAAKSLDVKQMNFVLQAASVFSRMLKVGAVGLNLPFIGANIAGDIFATAVTAGGKSIGLRAIAKGAKEAVSRDALHREMRREGTGFTSFDQLRDSPRVGMQELRATKDAGSAVDYAGNHPVKTAQALFRTAEDLVGRSEDFSRARLYSAAYDKFIKAGRTPEHARMLAAHEANFKLPNYMRSGNWMRPLNAIVPFLNARVQGSRSLIRAGADAPMETAVRAALYLFAPVAAVTAWNLADDKRKEAINDIPDFEKKGNLIWLPPVPVKDERGNYEVIKLKMPPDLGALVSPLERKMQEWAGLHPADWKDIVDDLIGVVSPVQVNRDPLKMVIANTPQAIKPAWQAASNYDAFRDRPKVPDSLKRLVPQDQVYPWTSGTARQIGGALGASPIKVEEFIKDTFAGLGSQALWASDKALAAAGKIPEDQVGGQNPMAAIAKRFGEAQGGDVVNRARAEKDSVRLEVVAGLRSGKDMRDRITSAIREKIITAADAKAMREEARNTPDVRQERRDRKLARTR